MPVFLLAFSLPAQAVDELNPQLTVARESINAVRSALNAELYAATKRGGVMAAMEVCNTRSPRILEQVSQLRKIQFRRIGTRVRNPVNTPDAWERKALNLFEQKLRQGENPANLEYDEDTGKEYLYIKALVMPEGGACLSCHGQKIEPAVQKRILELYPNDQSTGYRAGDLAGGFSIRIKNP